MKLADPDTERTVVGALLLASPTVRAQILAEFTPTDMYHGRHRTVTEAVADLHLSGSTVDLVTVTDELERRGQLEGLTAYLADCVSSVPTGALGKHPAKRVATLARRRRIAEAARNLAVAAEDLSTDLDAAVADAADTFARTSSAASAVEASSLVDGALEAFEHAGEPLGWGAPFRPLEDLWRIVPGWVHVVIGFRSAGKSALVDAALVGLGERGVRALIWSPEGAPSAEHLLRLARIKAGDVMVGWSEADVVPHLSWCAERLRFLPHETLTKLPQILAAADAHRARHKTDILLIDPFTSVDKFDGNEAWDVMLNRHLSRLQAWARSRQIAVVVVAHPKQRDRLPSGVRPVATDADIHGGIMWANQADSLVSIWRDEMAHTRPSEQVDVHVQKIRLDGRGGQMGRMATLHRDAAGRYHAVTP